MLYRLYDAWMQVLYGYYGQVDFVGAAIVASAAMLTAPGNLRKADSRCHGVYMLACSS
jgi:hypothetical protein